MTDDPAVASQATTSERSHRRLAISVLRYNPQEPGSAPHMQTYELEEADGMTLFIALNEIREKQDASLQFDFVCRAGICGSCAMVINGRPGLACRTLTQNLPAGNHARAAAGVRADRRSLGQHRQMDARDERAPADLGAHEGEGGRT